MPKGGQHDATVVVKKLKDGAQASPWRPLGVPLGVAPRQRYHHFPDGLSLCFTLDVLPQGLARLTGTKIQEELVEGSRFWHLSISRRGAGSLTPEEVEFWRRSFFEEKAIMEMPGLLSGVNAKHFFWRAE